MRIKSRGTTGRRRAPAALALVLMVSALFGLTSIQPAAAVGCWGDWCSGRDPRAMGCDADAYTVANTYIPGTQSSIELRWSPTCKTNWARVPASWGNSYPNNLRAIQPSTGYSQVGVVGSNGTYAWTAMIYSPVRCVYAGWSGPPGSAGTSCV